ncbi:MAG: hypothetical protein QOD75_28 [Blastocatellia bacterium]|jgi:hypothetical protein|nr:hypothetical protein [Blastocatellia bacterium]
MRKSEKQSGKVFEFSRHQRRRVDELETDLDALFGLPLAEFTGARNALAARLKKAGRGDEAVRVKALAKPSVSAWAVNQLYWNHREAFDQLIASGARFHKAQSSRSPGKVAEMRAAVEARRQDLAQLSDIAASVLQNAGHNPSLDTIRRITTTLEGISALGSRSDGPTPGRLTHDVDPPGFESFASFVPGPGSGSGLPAAVVESQSAKRKQAYRPATAAATAPHRKIATDEDVRKLEESRKARIAAAKASLQDAKKSLTKLHARAQSLDAAQKKAEAEVKKTEKQKRDAQESLKKATAASEAAAARARSVAVDAEEAASAVEDAERLVREASKEVKNLTTMV